MRTPNPHWLNRRSNVVAISIHAAIQTLRELEQLIAELCVSRFTTITHNSSLVYDGDDVNGRALNSHAIYIE